VHTHSTQTKQVGVFPCRGLVAPCQRTSGSIRALLVDVKRGLCPESRRWTRRSREMFGRGWRALAPTCRYDGYGGSV